MGEFSNTFLWALIKFCIQCFALHPGKNYTRKSNFAYKKYFKKSPFFAWQTVTSHLKILQRLPAFLPPRLTKPHPSKEIFSHLSPAVSKRLIAYLNSSYLNKVGELCYLKCYHQNLTSQQTKQGHLFNSCTASSLFKLQSDNNYYI